MDDGGTKPDARLKVFISYSRVDEGFAQELVAGLQIAGVEPYLDKHDIAAGEDWEARLGHLIEAADTVVFVISPGSVASPRCNWEVERSELLKKRILPVVWRMVPEAGVPHALKRLNYIFFDKPHSFGPSLGILAEALKTDLEWVREHTRLGEAALRWVDRGRVDSLLLRGLELHAAREWLARQPKYAPEPTNAHLDFIRASEDEEASRATLERKRLDEMAAAQADRENAIRAAEDALKREESVRRQRSRLRNISLAILLVASGVLTALSISTLQAYHDADTNHALALLATADRLMLEEKPTRALVVASALKQRGWLRDALSSFGLFPRATDDLVRIDSINQIASPASSVPIRSWSTKGPATAIATSSDGRRFAVGTNSGEITIVTVDDFDRHVRLIGHNGRVWSVKFNQDGNALASVTSTEIILWDLQGGRGRILCDARSEVTDVAFHPEGRLIAWTTRDGRLVVFDNRSGDRREFQDHPKRALALDFSSNGTILATSGDTGLVKLRRTDTWEEMKTLSTGRVDLVGLALSPDGRSLATASLSGPVDVWRFGQEKAGDRKIELAIPQDKRWRVRVSSDGQWLGVASWQGTVKLWNLQNLSFRGTLDFHDLRVNDIAFRTNDASVFSVSESGHVHAWAINRLNPMFHLIPNDRRETLNGRYSPDGKYFVAGGKDGMAVLFEVLADGNLRAKCRMQHDNWVFNAIFSNDASRIYSAGQQEGSESGDVIKLRSTTDCSLVKHNLIIKSAMIVRMAANPAGGEIALTDRQGKIWMWGEDGFSPPQLLPRVHTAEIGEIAFNHDGKFFATGGLDGKLLIWDTSTRQVLRELKGHVPGTYIYTVKFHPLRNILASSGTEPRVLIWDIDRPPGEELVKQLPLAGGANRLAFNSSGSLLAAGSGARAISIWETTGWAKKFQLNALTGIRSVYDFHPTRGDLAFDGENGDIRILPEAHGRARVPAPAGARLDGMSVSFSGVEGSPTPSQDAETIAVLGTCTPSP